MASVKSAMSSDSWPVDLFPVAAVTNVHKFGDFMLMYYLVVLEVRSHDRSLWIKSRYWEGFVPFCMSKDNS